LNFAAPQNPLTTHTRLPRENSSPKYKARKVREVCMSGRRRIIKPLFLGFWQK